MSFTKKPLEGEFGEITDEGLGIKHALFEFNPGKCLLPESFENYLEPIWEAPVRKDDVWLISYPRTGSTWCQEMIWLIENDLNYESAGNILQQIRAPIIEMSVILYEYVDHFSDLFNNSVDYVNQLPSPRCIRSHLPYELLPRNIDKVQPKIIYTMRHPKDLCVSYYYYFKLVHSFNVDFDTFCELFLNGSVACGGVFNHYLDFWKRRHEKNILVLQYEEMKENTKETVQKIAEFLEKPLSSEQIDSLVDFLSFRKMRNNKACNGEVLLAHKNGKDHFEKSGNHFIRKGEIGDWKNHMSEDMSRKFDNWIKENTKETDLVFE